MHNRPLLGIVTISKKGKPTFTGVLSACGKGFSGALVV